MRVALVNNVHVDQLGYYYIAAVLKQAGHEVRFFLTGRRLWPELAAFAPELVGLTAVTGNHRWAMGMATQLKAHFPGLPVILGGPHATYHPDILRAPGLDYICRGEGEGSIVELCRRLEVDEDPAGIPGIWVKRTDGEIVEAPFAPYLEDLDSLPFPDRSLYSRSWGSGYHLHPFMLTSRGCPFKCTFCFEPTLAELTRDKGKFVRFRSVDNVIAEGIELRDRWGAKGVEIVDDIFGMHRGWLREFAARWPREVGLSFNCSQRADLLTEETVALLAEAGCRSVGFGIESGSERVRNEILRKEVSDAQIRAAADAMRRHGIGIVTYNILGAPTETLEEAWQTLAFNQEICAGYAGIALMQPYPGSQVYEQARIAGLLDESAIDEIPFSFHDSTPLRHAHRRELTNLQKLFNLAVRWPMLTPLVRRAVRLPENPLFLLVFLAVHMQFYWRRVKQIPWRHLLGLVLNVAAIRRESAAGTWRARLWRRPDVAATGPGVRASVERGAV